MTVNSILLYIYIDVSLIERVLSNTEKNVVSLLVNVSFAGFKINSTRGYRPSAPPGGGKQPLDHCYCICIKPKLFQICEQKNDITQILEKHFYFVIVCHCVQSVLINE